MGLAEFFCEFPAFIIHVIIMCHLVGPCLPCALSGADQAAAPSWHMVVSPAGLHADSLPRTEEQATAVGEEGEGCASLGCSVLVSSTLSPPSCQTHGFRGSICGLLAPEV